MTSDMISRMELGQIVADSILAAAAGAIVATDRDGTIRMWNLGAQCIFGYSAEEALGQSLDLIIPELLRAGHWEGWRRVMQTGASHITSWVEARSRVHA